MSDYQIYYVDNDYIYCYKYNCNEDVNNIEFVIYNYKNKISSHYDVELKHPTDIGYFTCYKGDTYCITTNGDGNLTGGVLKIDKNMNKIFIAVEDIDIPNANIFVDNNKLYIKPNEYELFELVNDNTLLLVKDYNSCYYLKSYSLDDFYIIDYKNFYGWDCDDSYVYIKNNNNKEEMCILTSSCGINCMYGYKINNNKHRIVIIAMEGIYIFDVEKKEA